MDIPLLLAGAAGIAVGLAAAALSARGRAATAASAAATRDAAAGAARAAELARLTAERAALSTQCETLTADNATLRTEIAVARDAVARSTERAQLLEGKLPETIRALSGEALKANNEQFLALAEARFNAEGARSTGELEQRKQAVENLVAPLKETLAKVEVQLQEFEKRRDGDQRVLGEQIRSMLSTGDALRKETQALVGALRKPQVRGQWGELHLRRAVEIAGMSDRCDFAEQFSVQAGDRTLRPDLIVRLVGGKTIVVDSKVTLAAYLEAHEATDETVREARLDAHARHLRDHVVRLAEKAYWEQFAPSPEFVVLFVPGEAFLAPALERDASLLEDAFGKRVHIATPTTLISLLRAVAYGWQQDALADNAKQVFDLGRELYKRLATLGGHVDKLGRALTSAVGAYNGTVGSLERQVLVTARRLHELDIVESTLDPPTPVDDAVRPLTTDVLVASAEAARSVIALPFRDLAGADPAHEVEGVAVDAMG
ncbi:MAG TPA: DNA recombination protein RmuC [Mycobacteriales bacterium]|nr:DNA recombination protein RmuC [Mycobacteriales bacterium]